MERQSRLLFVVLMISMVSQAVNSIDTDSANLELYAYPMKCAAEQGKDYVGKAIRNLTLQDPGECCEECRATVECNAWTFRLEYANDNPNTCWLLQDASVVEEVRDDKVMVSGVRESQKMLKRNAPLETGVEYQSKSIYKIQTDSLLDCASSCAASLLCKAFTFDKKAKTCYAKGGTCCKKPAEKTLISQEVQG